MFDNKLTLVLGLLALASAASYFYHTQSRSASSSSSLYDFEDAYKYTDLEERMTMFREWMRKYEKEYSSIEGPLRFSVWNKNYDIVQEQNAKEEGFELEMNRFADLPSEEFAALYLGFIGNPEDRLLNSDNVEILDEINIPDSVDWRAKGAVTSVKDQGQCGGCYAFASAGALEGLAQINGKSLTSFSPQQIIDCSSKYGNQGCNGGLMDASFKYTQKAGITTEAKYPYAQKQGTCKTPKSGTFKNGGYKDVTADNDAQLAAALANAPVAVAVEADQSVFQLYKSGILSSKKCGTNLDHAILAVGYAKNYYIVKNSWNAGWGENGYIRIKRAKGKGICGINQMNSYPTK